VGKGLNLAILSMEGNPFTLGPLTPTMYREKERRNKNGDWEWKGGGGRSEDHFF